MCGIHGVINSTTGYNAAVCNFVRQAFTANSLRGMDSSGLFQIGTTSKSVYLHKDAVNGTDFVAQDLSEAIIRDTDSSLFTVCHVRAKTQGAVSAENAHPFMGWNDEKRVMGVHNGSLNNWKSAKDGKDFEVDSAWAIQQIANEGHAAFSKFQGAYCIVWWDEEEPRKINFCRNDQRPMHFLFSKDGKRMMFASEAGMLVWLAERCKFESDGRVREMPVGKIVTFDSSGDKISWDMTDAPKAPVSTYTPATRSSYGYNSNSSHTTDARDDRHRPIQFEQDLRNWRSFMGGATTPITSMHSNARPMSEVGADEEEGFQDDDFPFEVRDFNNKAATFGTTFAYEGDFKFPENLIPPRRHLEATDAEIANAKMVGTFGALALVTWDTYSSGRKQLMGSCMDDTTGVTYDVVMNEVPANSANRMVDLEEQACCVIGLENDGTLIVHRATKRMSRFMSA